MPDRIVTKRDAVIRAMDEFDRLGRDAFLGRYGFWKAKQYYVVARGKRYDSKALYGVAYGFEHPNAGPLASNDFSGGDAQVARRLQKLGFKVDRSVAGLGGPPHGSRLARTWLLTTIPDDERLYRGHRGYDDDLRVVYRYDSFVANHLGVSAGDIALLRDKTQVLGCAVIERVDSEPGEKPRNHCPHCGSTALKERHQLAPRFRCECGGTFDEPDVRVAECTRYAACFGDSYQDLTGSLSLRELWQVAPRLNKQLAILELDSPRVATLLADVTRGLGRADEPSIAARAVFGEGERTTVLANRYERDPRARKACIKHYGYRCQACGFSFADRYGAIGREVIEVHHLEPLGARGSRREVDAIRDLRPVCANCHTIIHRRTPPLALEEVARLLSRGALADARQTREHGAARLGTRRSRSVTPEQRRESAHKAARQQWTEPAT